MGYFTIAIVTAWVLGVFYIAMSVLMAIGLRISTPIVPRRTYKLITYLIALAFFGSGLHYLHLGYFGAVRGILPSQESGFATLANVLQAIAVTPTIFLAWYLRYRIGRGEAGDNGDD